MLVETKHLLYIETKDMNWDIVLKETDKKIGQISAKIDGDVFEMISMDMDEHQGVQYRSEAVEMLCNTAFYRVQARKICVFTKDDEAQRQVFEAFGFHEESVHGNQNCQVLYKEEYIMFLRKQGKALNAEKLDAMRNVFLVVALAGVFLFGIDMARGVTTLMTSLYAYLTGIGAAGAIFSAHLSNKKMHEQKGNGDHNAR